MLITSFDYHEYNWNLTNVPFGDLNLIVGKNAVGKSKTLASLVQVAKVIKGDISNVYLSHRCKLVFRLDEGDELEYEYSIGNNKEIESEFLKKGDETILRRNGSEAWIRDDSVNPPTNKLCIQSWRDTEKYPEFEAIMRWAEQIKGFSFSNLSQPTSFLVPSMFNEQMELSSLFEHIDDEKKAFIIKEMRELDYEIEKIDPISLLDKLTIITFRESGVGMPLLSNIMSNGMLRVFCILSYLVYVSAEEGAKTLLIDDLGEGLDYSRSKKLSKIVFDYCEKHGIQLIVTSNDNFLMNAVDLKHWIILQRENEQVSAISEKTHPDIFLRFKRTGLNNFDIFATDFVSKYLKKQE